MEKTHFQSKSSALQPIYFKRGNFYFEGKHSRLPVCVELSTVSVAVRKKLNSVHVESILTLSKNRSPAHLLLKLSQLSAAANEFIVSPQGGRSFTKVLVLLESVLRTDHNYEFCSNYQTAAMSVNVS